MREGKPHTVDTLRHTLEKIAVSLEEKPRNLLREKDYDSLIMRSYILEMSKQERAERFDLVVAACLSFVIGGIHLSQHPDDRFRFLGELLSLGGVMSAMWLVANPRSDKADFSRRLQTLGQRADDLLKNDQFKHTRSKDPGPTETGR